MNNVSTQREDSGKFRFTVMPENGDWEKLTLFLHEAYKEHALANRCYKACGQNAEETKQRCRGNTCLLAWSENELAGTVTMEKRCHGNVAYGYIMQLAVAPQFRQFGLGHLLLIQMEELARQRGYAYLSCDTASTAVKLVNWYVRQGWRKVACISHGETNYYSTVFQKDWEKASSGTMDWRYPWSCLKCRLLWTSGGKLRLFGRILKAVRNTFRSKGK